MRATLIHFIALVFCAAVWGATPVHAQQTIYGVHWWKPGADAVMNGKKGWSVEIVNADGVHGPGDLDKARLRDMIRDGFTPIIRINWGWFETIPRPDKISYDAFADRCAFIVDQLYNQLGEGMRVQWFQIGNEYNLDYEYQPVGDGFGAPAVVYSEYFSRTYSRVKSVVSGASNIRILVGPVANWAPNRPSDGYQGNPPIPLQGFYYDRYYRDVVQRIGAADGYAIHTYGGHRDIQLPHGLGAIGFGVDNNLDSYPGLDKSNTRGFDSYRVLARIIRDYGNPSLPVLITETNTSAHKTIRRSSSCWSPEPCNPGDDCRLIPPGLTYPSGWMQEAFQKIHNWNQSQMPKILALNWFVYDARGEWAEFAIDESAPCNMAQARSDFDQLTATTNYLSPGLGGGRGQPRVQYAREYWVVDSRATRSEFLDIVARAYPNRITVGFSYDDAGIGDLDTRKVVVWGDEHDRNVLRDWYQQHYGGVTVEFRAIPGRGTWRFGPYATSPPASGRGSPRVQYAREYWVVDSRASSSQFRNVASQAFDGKKTVGFSYDDAGIGDLDRRTVVVFGNEFPQQTLRNWYNQYYPGVSVSFRALP